VLYDLVGARGGEAFRSGAHGCDNARTLSPAPPPGNNLGIYHHYGDRLRAPIAFIDDVCSSSPSVGRIA